MAATVFPHLFRQARPALARFAIVSALGSFSLSTAGCAGAGNFTWYKDVPNADWRTDITEYEIGVGDTITISVYEQLPLSATGKIRRDGRIALPLAGEVVAAGKHPSQLARELEGRLKEFVVTPRVTVNIDQSQPVTVTALGEIKNVGALTMEPPARLVEAIARAGGPSDFADKSRIFVLRQFPEFQRIRFTYDAIVRNDGGAAGFPLRTGDVIVIE
jgi:polysaccharide biosynthesis/export protein